MLVYEEWISKLIFHDKGSFTSIKKDFFKNIFLDLIIKLYFLWTLFKTTNNYVCFIYMNVCTIKKKKKPVCQLKNSEIFRMNKVD